MLSIEVAAQVCLAAISSGNYAGQSYLRLILVLNFCGASMQSLPILIASIFEC